MNEFKGTPGSWSIDQTGDIVSGPYNVCIPYATKAEDKVLMAAAKDLLEALIAMEAEKSDYMRINNLGDPAAEHSNKQARAAIAKAIGQ